MCARQEIRWSVTRQRPVGCEQRPRVGVRAHRSITSIHLLHVAAPAPLHAPSPTYANGTPAEPTSRPHCAATSSRVSRSLVVADTFQSVRADDHTPDGPSRALTVAPEEDQGAATARWFAYQYACTAKECLLMLVQPIPWVICEWHADFVSGGKGPDQPHVLVSVKHRSIDYGAWPLAELGDRGGFRTLYRRWEQSGRQHQCRWITNAGLRPGPGQARRLAEIANSGREVDSVYADDLRSFAVRLKSDVGATTEEDVSAFLAALEMVSTGGDEHSMQAQVIDEVARPILAELGISTAHARTAYSATLNLVWDCVRGLDPNFSSGWLVGAPASDGERRRRTISVDRLLQHLRLSGVPIPTAYAQSRSSESLMLRKLRAGRLGPTVLNSAPRLRQRWYELEAAYRSDLPGPIADEVARVRSEVAHRASLAESKVRVPGNFYGQSMYRELGDLLPEVAPKIPAGPSELMGCALQLTDECRIWWSDPFDTRSEAVWLSEGPQARSPLPQEVGRRHE